MKRALFTACLVLAVFAGLTCAAELKTYTVAGDSMEPTLSQGDTVMVGPVEGPLTDGQLVAIMLAGEAHPMVKRVAAVPGDRLEIRGRELWVNGRPHEPASDMDPARWKSTVSQLTHYGWVVPKGMLFVLGDNPVNSRDSRRLGLISIDQINGVVVKTIKRGKGYTS